MPAQYFTPSSSASTPFPGTERKFTASGAVSLSSSALRTIASASGCSDCFSSPAASVSSSFSESPFGRTDRSRPAFPRSAYRSCPCTTVLILCSSSSDSADLKSTPSSAPRPVPTMIATGVASPSAHGQEMTSTEMPHAKRVVHRLSKQPARRPSPRARCTSRPARTRPRSYPQAARWAPWSRPPPRPAG